MMLLPSSEPGCKLHNHAIFECYFSRVYQDCLTDGLGIGPLRSSLNYPKVAERFRMIKDDTVGVVVTYGDPGPSETIGKIIGKGFANRDDWRSLAPYTTSIYSNDFSRYLRQGGIQQVLEGLYLWVGTYDKQCGLSDELPDPADLIIHQGGSPSSIGECERFGCLIR